MGADGLLAARLAAGDDDAIAEAFDRFGTAVFAAARRVLRDASAAQDVVQDVFVALWTHPERYDETRGGLCTFLTTVAQRRALDAVRSELRRAGREHRLRVVPEQDRSPADETDARVVAEAVRDAVRLLPADQRRVVELAYFQGMSYRAVAAEVGIPEGTAKSRLRLALAKLGSALDRELLETS
jgi:RNA polymerase sigma-70 factor, ECF subfamily